MIAWLIDVSLRNRFVVLAAAALVVAAGIHAARVNPIDAIPDISETQVIVFAEWPGRSPQEVEDQVTYPMVVNLRGLAGVKAVRSSSAFGFVMVNVIFGESTDLYFARQRILERMNLIQEQMPDGVTPVLGPDASAVGQVLWYTLEADGHDLGELRALQDFFVRYQLGAVEGVAEVASIGGFVREYQVDLDPRQMEAYGISLREVVEAIERSNRNVGGKVVEQHGMEYVVRGIGLIEGVADLERVAVSAAAGTPVYLSQLGAVQLGPAFRRGALEQGGREVVGGVVAMRYGESAPEILRRVKERIAELQPGLPQGVRIVPFYDRSALIDRAVGTLRRALVEETLLVVLAHVLFLAHFRSILIVSAPLPIAVLISFILMRVFGITSNIMSLMGIAIAIGVLVDAGIVITENIFRRLELDQKEGRQRPLLEAVREASHQIGRPIFFSMAIIILAFLPVFSLTGEEGKLFHPLAFTKTFAMLGATLLSVSLVPVLATFLIRGRIHAEEHNPVMRGARRLYQPVLRWALRHKATTLLIAAGGFVMSLVLVAGAGVLLSPVQIPVAAAATLGSPAAERVADRLSSARGWLDQRLAAGIGNEFMPPLDEGTLMFMPVTSNAISLTAAIEIVKKQDAVLRSFPEVASVVGKVGRAESALDPAPINMFETLVELKEPSEWRPGMTKEKLIAEMTERSRLPGVTTIWQQPIRNRIDMLATGIPTQVGVKIFGPDLQLLEAKAREVADVLRGVRGAVDIYPEQILGTPYLEIEVDREAVARYGASVADVLEVVETAVGGTDVTTTIEGRNRFAVRVRYARELRADVDSLKRVLVAVPALRGVVDTGPASPASRESMDSRMTQVPLAELATIRVRPGPSMISAENGLLRERVFLNVRGRDVGSFVEEAKRVVEGAVSLPAGYFLEWSGQYEHQVRARNRLLLVVPACFGIIFLVLWMTYRSGKDAAHVILAIPFALTGGNILLWGLNLASAQLGWKTEYHLSVAVWVGYIALFGTAVQTAVVMVVYLEEALVRAAASAALTVERIRVAAMEGAVLRLRPKLMTVSTVVLGLLPIMWSSATGSEVAKPIAAPVLGGMVSSLVHVLLVTPVIWTWLKERELRRGSPTIVPTPGSGDESRADQPTS